MKEQRRYIIILAIFMIAIGLWSIIKNIIEYKSITGILWISNLTAVIIGLALITKNKKLLAMACFMAVFPGYTFFKEITIKYHIIRWLLVHTIGPLAGVVLVLKSKKVIGEIFSYKEQIPAFIFVGVIEIISFFASTAEQNINFSHDFRLLPYLFLIGIVWFFLIHFINNKQK